jgi:trehalose 6-phosphate phosphatase
MARLAHLPLERAALFLDVDGTIVPFAARPEAVRVSAASRMVLKRATDQLGGRIAVLSGRTIASVDTVLASAVRCISGVHGLQRRNALGQTDLTPPHSRVADAGAVLDALARAQAGLRVEHKGPSVAVHFRQAPQAEAAVLETVTRLAAATGLRLQRGHLVAELRTPGPDKGSALNRFMLEAPFQGATPVFLGDDLTDETAFAEAARHGGAGILVGPRRKTRAGGGLAHPAAALGWISRSLDRGAFDFQETAWAG